MSFECLSINNEDGSRWSRGGQLGERGGGLLVTWGVGSCEVLQAGKQHATTSVTSERKKNNTIPKGIAVP